LPLCYSCLLPLAPCPYDTLASGPYDTLAFGCLYDTLACIWLPSHAACLAAAQSAIPPPPPLLQLLLTLTLKPVQKFSHLETCAKVSLPPDFILASVHYTVTALDGSQFYLAPAINVFFLLQIDKKEIGPTMTII